MGFAFCISSQHLVLWNMSFCYLEYNRIWHIGTYFCTLLCIVMYGYALLHIIVQYCNRPRPVWFILRSPENRGCSNACVGVGRARSGEAFATWRGPWWCPVIPRNAGGCFVLHWHVPLSAKVHLRVKSLGPLKLAPCLHPGFACMHPLHHCSRSAVGIPRPPLPRPHRFVW